MPRIPDYPDASAVEMTALLLASIGGVTSKIAIVQGAADSESGGHPYPNTTSFDPADYAPGSLLIPTSYPASLASGDTIEAAAMVFRREGTAGSESWKWVAGSYRANDGNADYQVFADGATADNPQVLYGTATTLDADGNPTPDATSYPPADYGVGTLLVTNTAPTAADNGTGVTTTYEGLDMTFRRTGGAGSEVWEWVSGSFRASNSNGDYQRFADGAQVCRFLDGTLRTTSSAFGNVFVNSAVQTFTFPAAFAATPEVAHAPKYGASGSGAPWMASDVHSATQAKLYLIGAASTANGYIGYVATGKWAA